MIIFVTKVIIYLKSEKNFLIPNIFFGKKKFFKFFIDFINLGVLKELS